MELYASGFNAWGQLCFDGHASHDNEDDDLYEFACVFRGGTIEHVRASLAHTTVMSHGSSIVTAGCIPRQHQALYERDAMAYSRRAEACNGSIVRYHTGAPIQLAAGLELTPYHHTQAVIDTSGAICQITAGGHEHPFPELPTCTQVVAYDTGFAALTSTGSVYTWGDERYGACLGRDISDDSPADRPGLVTALEDLPTGAISKIAAGGYMLAALTAGKDLYLWGGHPGRKSVPADVTDEPAPVVIDEQDIADMAVGESHLIVLTTEGRVFVIGENGNGQLGLPVDSADAWRPVEPIGLRGRGRAVGVAAGPRSSFIIVKEAAL